MIRFHLLPPLKTECFLRFLRLFFCTHSLSLTTWTINIIALLSTQLDSCDEFYNNLSSLLFHFFTFLSLSYLASSEIQTRHVINNCLKEIYLFSPFAHFEMCTHPILVCKKRKNIKRRCEEKKRWAKEWKAHLTCCCFMLAACEGKGNMEHNFNVRFRIPEKFAQEAFFLFISLCVLRNLISCCAFPLSLPFHRQAQHKKVQHMQHDFFFLIINSFYELFYLHSLLTAKLLLMMSRCCWDAEKKSFEAAATEVPKKVWIKEKTT